MPPTRDFTSKLNNPGFGLLGAYTQQQDQSLPPQEFSLIPANIKMYLATMLNKNATLTMNDLTAGDVDAIKRAIATSMVQTGQSEGTFGYGQYQGEPRKRGSRFDDPQSLLDLISRSFYDPTFRMETLLGQAKYRITPQGTAEVSDAYDFNLNKSYYDREGGTQVLKDVWNLFRQGRPSEALETLGGLFGPLHDSDPDQKGITPDQSQNYTLNVGSLQGKPHGPFTNPH